MSKISMMMKEYVQNVTHAKRKIKRGRRIVVGKPDALAALIEKAGRG